MAGMLYLVPTPIGNLGDISPRAKATLESADFIAAEDTRVTLKLLNHLELRKPLVSYYEHNKSFKGEKILDRILAGETWRLGIRRRKPRHLGPRRGPGKAMRPGRGHGLRHSRPLRRHHRVEHLRSVYRPLLL